MAAKKIRGGGRDFVQRLFVFWVTPPPRSPEWAQNVAQKTSF